MSDSSRDELIEQFLEGQPRAQQWREWKEALQERRTLFRSERDDVGPGPRADDLDEALETLEIQIRALATEEALTQFVEDALQYTLAVQSAEGFPDDEEP